MRPVATYDRSSKALTYLLLRCTCKLRVRHFGRYMKYRRCISELGAMAYSGSAGRVLEIRAIFVTYPLKVKHSPQPLSAL